MQRIKIQGETYKVSDFLDGFNITVVPESKNVLLYAINQDKKELFIKFKNGDKPQFLYTVNAETLLRLTMAESVGSYVQRVIVKRFSSTKIPEQIFKHEPLMQK